MEKRWKCITCEETFTIDMDQLTEAWLEAGGKDPTICEKPTVLYICTRDSYHRFYTVTNDGLCPRCEGDDQGTLYRDESPCGGILFCLDEE